MFIEIILKSKNKNSLLKFFKIFKKFSKNKELQLNRIIGIHQKNESKKIFTVLKSPHVNKTAQEQYEFRLFSKKLKIDSCQIIKILILLKKFQTSLFSDVQFIFKFRINKHKLILNKHFNLNKNIVKINSYHLKCLESYILLYHFYGKYKFNVKFE